METIKTQDWKAGDTFDYKNEDGQLVWQSGIHIPGHSKAIVCYGDSEADATAKRDAILAALAKQAEATPVGAAKLQTYGDNPWAAGASPEFGPRDDGEYVKLSDVEKMLAQRAGSGEAKPVAYLKFRAAQQWSGVGGHVIEHNEWLETCHAHEIGDDKQPAFPVYTAPPSQPDSESDAARYRWLRHGDNDTPLVRMLLPSYEPYLLRNDLLDAAIDAAMAAQQTSKGVS